MAILIAESGGSRTDWASIEASGETYRFHTIGMNPNFVSFDVIPHVIEIVKSKLGDRHTEQLFFYGSGVSSEQNRSRLSDILSDKGLPDHIIKSDLDASAEALFGNEPAIVCILGTGSNAGIFDGDHISKLAPSLGYLMGDYGSGFQIGKHMIRDYYYKKLPAELADYIRLNYDHNRDMISLIYKQDQPNRFIASFSSILDDFREEEYTAKLVKSCIKDFVELQLLPLVQKKPDYPIGFTGSIGYEFQPLLEEVLSNYKLKAANVIKQPIDALIEFHSISD
jgi:N-acetylglucosamine kinase-like BadF-type ATPase